MNTRKFKILFLTLFLLVLVGSAAVYFFSGDAGIGPVHVSAKVKEIAGYKSWTKVNSKPTLMDDQVASMCAMPERAGSLTVESGRDNPHINKYFSVYVNKIGETAMMEQKTPDFPEGSVILKEKLSAPDNQTPELMTVMIKQKKGTNPETGDWEYMVTDGKGEKIEGRGNLANCQTCHEARKNNGYVFRNYVDQEVMKKWK